MQGHRSLDGQFPPCEPLFLTPPAHPAILNYCSLENLRLWACSAGLRGIGGVKRWARRFPMFIDLAELELHPIDFQEEFPPGAVDLGPDVRQLSPLKSSGRAQLVEEHHGKYDVIPDIRLQGGLTTSLELSCARCLDAVVQNVARDFELLYRPQGTDAGHEELSITAAEAEVGYYKGEGLLLEDVLREQVLLALPLKITCRPECKGLCPQCGKNLNQEQCSCSTAVEDPRWAALKDVRSRLEH